MKPRLSTTAALSLALVLGGALATPGGAAELDLELSAHSHYVWRGITLTDGPVLQPSITGTQGRFSVNVWGNLELDDATDRSGELTEIDVTLNYSVVPEGPVTVDVGLIEYTFPASTLAGTREAYVSLGFGGIVSPVLNLYYDFDLIDDLYANLGISFGSELANSWSWSLDLTAGYAGEDFARIAAGGTDSGLFDGVAKLGIAHEGATVGFGAYAALVEHVDSDVLPDQPTDFLAGVSVSWSFD